MKRCRPLPAKTLDLLQPENYHEHDNSDERRGASFSPNDVNGRRQRLAEVIRA